MFLFQINAVLLKFLFIKNAEKNFLHKNMKQLFWSKMLSTLIRDASWAANQYIRMISEGSHDTEDWSNDAENSAFK